MVTGEVEPAVNEHGTVTAGEHEAVAVEPLGFRRIVAEAASAEENGADLGTSEREAEVAGVAGMDRINRESACLGGCL